MKWFKSKRGQIAQALPKNSVLALASLPEYFRQVDVKYPYRQESNFYYLTGFEQADSLFFLFPSGRSILFSLDKDPVKELWEGPIYGPKEIKKRFLINEAYPLSEIDRRLDHLLKRKTKILYDPLHSLFDKKLKSFKIPFKSAGEFLKKFRRIKDETEIKLVQKAITMSAFGHKQVAQALKPGLSERALHGIFIKSIMEKGSNREAYGGIFACGSNATVLHYGQNHSLCKKGELLLVDAGAENSYYSSDISRVYPVSGTFSKNQKNLYEKLLKLQKKLIKEVQPGVSLHHINKKMAEGLTKILMDFGFLKGSFNKNWDKKSYKKYCPHSVGHLLGLDVHDVSFNPKEPAILEPGMILTIEPGIYISKQDKKAEKDLKGSGFRIEDNILVTATGQKNLSKAIPKELVEIERLCAS